MEEIQRLISEAYAEGKKDGAAEEREACARAVEKLPEGTWGDERGQVSPWSEAAAAIRARST